MGKVQDMKNRKILARVDDEKRRRMIGTARDIIYNKHYAVDSDKVEAILKEHSLVPTVVSVQLDATRWKLKLGCRMRSPESLHNLASISINCSLSISCMSSN